MKLPATSRRGRRSACGAIVAVAALAGLIFLLHGRSLSYGLFMDDHAHLRQLRECDWSLAGLTNACRIELVGGVIELWWLPKTTLYFFRPVAFGLMKLTYTLTGWSPVAMHVVSLVWHWVACMLLMSLLRPLGASAWLAWVVAGLYAIHPAHVATVQWIACQTELMVTAFLLGATLCFARFRRWPGFTPGASCPLKKGTGSEPGRLSHGQNAFPRGACPLFQRTPSASSASPPQRWVTRFWAAGAAVLFALALGCRENAVMFPLVLAAVEPLVGRQRRRAALALYAVFGMLLVAYFVTRAALLGGVSLPPRPYVVPPSDPDFARYVFDKALYYLLGQYLLIPCVPIGGLAYLRAHPHLFYGLSAGLVALLTVICVRSFRRPAGLLAPAWLLGFTAPLLPVFASPHHLYLPGVGWAVTALLVLHGIDPPRLKPAGLATRLRSLSTWGVVLLTGGVFGVTTYWFGVAFETGQAVEDCIAEEVAAAPSGLQDGDILYMANMPALGHYARLAVEARTGRRHLRLIPLTWAPRLLGPATPTELTWIDDRTIEIRVADDRYFAGPLGLLVREATGCDVPDEVNRMSDCGFRVRMLQRDAAGVAALRFEFDQPLSASGRHLFWTSRARWACEVRR